MIRAAVLANAAVSELASAYVHTCAVYLLAPDIEVVEQSAANQIYSTSRASIQVPNRTMSSSNNTTPTLLTALVLLLLPLHSHAQNTAPLNGLWGTEAQCARELITPKGTKHFAPFDMRADWLGHGDVWCRLNWWSVDSTDASNMTAVANAVCGEDIERDYKIRFNLIDDTLTIIWNWEYRNGPLNRCPLEN